MSDNFSDFDNLVDLFTTIGSKRSELETALDGKINTTDIANNLTTTTAGKVLDATQGKALNDSISATNSQVQTLESALDSKINTSNIANNLTTTTAGKVLDARQGKTLNDSISATNSQVQTLTTQVSTKAEQSLLAPIQTTLVASQAYAKGNQFVYQGLLYTVTAAISQGGTITIDGNCKLSNDIVKQISLKSNDILIASRMASSNISAPNGNYTVSFNFTSPTGYSPLGVAGYTTNDRNANYNIVGVFLSGNSVVFQGVNTSGGTMTFKPTAHIIFKANN